MIPLTFGILTVSDTCYRDRSKDASGPEVERLVTDVRTETGAILKGRISCKDIVPDDQDIITKTLTDWSDVKNINVILTSGGTGFSARDVTPEATKKVIYKEAPGMATAMLVDSLKKTPMAMLTRAVCGIRGKTLIINLPGSPKAVRECMSAIAVAIPHAVALLVDDKLEVQGHHVDLQGGKGYEDHSAKHQNLAMVLDDVANRLRQSPYPMISLDRANAIILEEIASRYVIREDNELSRCLTTVSLENSHGRILAKPVHSQCDLPPFRASIKDGYAVIAEDGAGPRRVLAGIEAGQEPSSINIGSGECVRINTGAPLPDDANAVVQVEDTRLLTKAQTTEAEKMTESMIEILVAPRVGQDIRNVGSDIAKGALVLNEKTRISAAEMGILAACGVTEVAVFKKPVVGILSTGNELQAPGESPKPGHVYDSNKITLMATFKECDYDSIDFGIVRDNLHDMITRIEEALKVVDVLVTSGSVSMGDKDMLKPILKQVFKANIHFGRVNLKPGKPTTFATCVYRGEKKYLLCLPGNPVSAMVTSRLFAIPLLHGLSLNNSAPTIVKAKLMTDYDLDPRPEYARAVLEWADEDLPRARITGNQISSRLLSCKRANALLMLPARTDEKSSLKSGDRVSAMLIGFENMRR